MTDGPHIVDILIAERAARLQSKLLVWAMLRRPLYSLLNYRAAITMVDAIKDMTGRQSFAYVSAKVGINTRPAGLENIPMSGPVIIICNHPTGLADGLFMFEALRPRRPDHVYLANADALRVIPACEDIIIPVEWVKAKRSPAKAKATLKAMKAASAAGQAIVIFPSGALAMKRGGKIIDRPWMQTAAGFARKHNIPIVPVHIQAQNSALYYIFGKLHGELRDITLFREMLNKGSVTPQITFGAPIDPQTLDKDPKRATRQVRDIVERLKPA